MAMSDRTKRRKIQQEVEKNVQKIIDEAIFIQQPLNTISADQTLATTLENDYEQDNTEEDFVNNAIGLDEQQLESFQSDSDSNYSFQCDDSNSDDNDTALNNHNLSSDLADWASKSNIPQIAVSDLLHILRQYHPELPRDPRTLLDTHTKITTKHVSNGEYYHIGIKEGILSALKSENVLPTHGEAIPLQINIDGLPLFKSSNSQFWPILGMVTSFHNREPFLIGLYHGESKPSNLHFLDEFVTECTSIYENGIQFEGRIFSVFISAFICDTPARAMIKNIKGHSGYYGCDKCDQRGVYKQSVTFPELNAHRRTDADFRRAINEEHHLGHTPLTQLKIDMVSAFPADYMHLVCLGVMRKLIKLWTKGPLKTRQGSRVITEISQRLVELKCSVPTEFSRRPRPLTEYERWKATEFRQFLLYTGPVVLLKCLPKPLYENFMHFSLAMFIFTHPYYCLDYCQYAHELIVTFVKGFAILYGTEMVSYNVHGLVHLSKDVQRYGPLDNVSCFPFENYLGKLKRMVRKPSSPLQQVVRRLSEVKNNRQKPQTPNLFAREHQDGPVPPGVSARQYKVANLPHCTIKLSDGDNCIQIDNSIAIVRNFFINKGENFIMYENFSSIRPFSSYLEDSSVFGIYKVKQLSGNIAVAPVSHISRKYVLLPHRNSYVAIPLLHS